LNFYCRCGPQATIRGSIIHLSVYNKRVICAAIKAEKLRVTAPVKNAWSHVNELDLQQFDRSFLGGVARVCSLIINPIFLFRRTSVVCLKTA
jgi:hypothetical protein